MKLSILRHGIAAERGPQYPDDSKRPLTPEGRTKTRQVARALQKLQFEFDLILSSPLVRARQTAEIVAAVFRAKKHLQLCPQLQPGQTRASLIRVLQDLRAQPENILLIGHEPDLSRLISALVCGHERGAFRMKKAGFCQLQIEQLRNGPCATLDLLVPPRLLLPQSIPVKPRRKTKRAPTKK